MRKLILLKRSLQLADELTVGFRNHGLDPYECLVLTHSIEDALKALAEEPKSTVLYGSVLGRNLFADRDFIPQAREVSKGLCILINCSSIPEMEDGGDGYIDRVEMTTWEFICLALDVRAYKCFDDLCRNYPFIKPKPKKKVVERS
jgi:hypothetical protein